MNKKERKFEILFNIIKRPPPVDYKLFPVWYMVATTYRTANIWLSCIIFTFAQNSMNLKKENYCRFVGQNHFALKSYTTKILFT